MRVDNIPHHRGSKIQSATSISPRSGGSSFHLIRERFNYTENDSGQEVLLQR